METNSQEWEIFESSYKGKYTIGHNECSGYGREKGWAFCRMPFHENKWQVKGTKIYHCEGCKKEAPSHIVFQVNILNGE